MNLRLEISYFVAALNTLFLVVGFIWLIPQLFSKLKKLILWNRKREDNTIDFSHRSVRGGFVYHIQGNDAAVESRPLLADDDSHLKDT